MDLTLDRCLVQIHVLQSVGCILIFVSAKDDWCNRFLPIAKAHYCTHTVTPVSNCPWNFIQYDVRKTEYVRAHSLLSFDPVSYEAAASFFLYLHDIFSQRGIVGRMPAFK